MRAIVLSVTVSMLLALPGLAQKPAAPPPGVTVFDYRDWLDCCKLANGTAEAVIVPVAGARLSAFSIGGKNILFEDHSVDGLDIEAGVRLEKEEWVQWDGCQPDLFTEQGGHQCDQLWVSPYKLAKQGPYLVSFRSAMSKKHMAQVTKTFTLDEKKPQLKFDYSVANTDKAAHKWGCYYRILCKAPGFVIFPVSKGSRYEGGYSFYNDPETNKKLEAIKKECLVVKDGMLVLAPHNLQAATHAQVLTDTADGWVACTWKDILLLLRFEVQPGKEYRDNCTLSIYFEREKISLEPRGPCLSLKQDEAASCNTIWRLDQLPETIKELDKVDSILQRIKVLLQE